MCNQQTHTAHEAELFEQIGWLPMELEWLKKLIVSVEQKCTLIEHYELSSAYYPSLTMPS
jgi:hypothetical protein